MAVKRLDRLLSELGVATRSELRLMIKSGRVTVDGTAAVQPDMKIEEQGHVICVDGVELCTSRLRYFMMDKPEGVLSATEDKRQETVLDILPPEVWRRGLFPAGRLDQDTTGLMILTDDGALAHEILAPQKHVPKQYRVTIDIPMTEEMVHRFAEGIELKDGRCRPAELTIESEDTGVVTLREGRYHQIKRMFGCCGAVVTGLHRLSMGALRLDDTLAPGECRPVSEEEISLLRQQHLPE